MEKVYSGALVILLLGFGLTTFAQNQAPRIVIDPKGHAAKVNSLLYTPDGDHIISVSEDKTIRVWESSSGDLLNKFELEIGDGYEGMPYAATISPDGKLLAIAGYPVSSHEENYIVIIDVLKETQIAIAVGHENVINGLGFTADGRHLISAGDDGIIKIWSVSTGNFEEKASIEVGLPVAGLSVNLSNGRVAIATRDQNVLIYDLSGIDGNRDNYPSFALKKHKEVINKVCYSPDGKYLASCSFNNDLIVWDNNGEIIFQKEEFDFPLNALAFSYDSKVLVALDVVGRGFSFGLPGGILHTSDFVSHDNTVFSAVFSPQSARGNYVVASSGGTRNEIITWNAISAKTINTITGMGNFIGGLTFGKGMELFISTDFADGPVTKYQYSFDFNTFEIAKNPTLIPGQKKREGAKR
ncbi:MAG: hypothetical protein OEY51_03600, partial [Cyclobacteriaceae bacterium]|nr:hypothetical protein [Cyclobacteriaceae bacterium]